MPRPLLALALLLLYFAVVFGLRTLQHRRATGTTGFHGLSGAPGSLEWLGGVLFFVGIVLGLLAPLAEALDLIDPLWDPPAWQVALGVLLTFVGGAATYLAQVSMGASWRIGVDAGERTRLVVHGPFALVRNPIFTCMLAAALGLVVLLPNALALASLLALLGAVELQVRFVEEPHLLRIHGRSYRDYAARVGRFLPGLGRLR